MFSHTQVYISWGQGCRTTKPFPFVDRFPFHVSFPLHCVVLYNLWKCLNCRRSILDILEKSHMVSVELIWQKSAKGYVIFRIISSHYCNVLMDWLWWVSCIKSCSGVWPKCHLRIKEHWRKEAVGYKSSIFIRSQGYSFWNCDNQGMQNRKLCLLAGRWIHCHFKCQTVQ